MKAFFILIVSCPLLVDIGESARVFSCSDEMEIENEA